MSRHDDQEEEDESSVDEDPLPSDMDDPDEPDADDETDTGECPKCGASIYADADYCPICNAAVRPARQGHNIPRWFVVVVVTALLFAMFGGVLWIFAM
jgi:hypothetical protein